jgi:S-adenosylmethionine synthetase
VSGHSLLLRCQHAEDVPVEEVRRALAPLAAEIVPPAWMPSADRLFVNPAGPLLEGGGEGDTGMTGRKITVDTYGGAAPHGGGAFSGKDPVKIDRSGAYAARWLAKNVAAAGLARRVTVQLSYARGLEQPLAVQIDTHGTGRADEARIEAALRDLADLSPAGIRKRLDLRRPVYERTACFGHFGREPEADGGFSWERCDLAEELARLR